MNLGRHSYINGTLENPFDVEVSIGAFTSIASECAVIGGTGFHPPMHNRLSLSTFPFGDHGWGGEPSQGRGGLRIGNDVWIGYRCILMDGITIGDGAIVGAGSVVTKDVPPYAIVGGNPAKLIRYRFSERQIKALPKWWEWTDEQIYAAMPDFRDVTKFTGSGMHIFIAGLEGLLGGAEYEALHLARAFRLAGIGVHWVPLGMPSPDLREQMDAMGCVVHGYRPGIFEGQVVLNLCNGDHLRKLPEIYEAGAPKAYIFGDCMARTTYGLDGHKAGHITHFVFQSQYQRNNHLTELEKIGPVPELAGYRPYFSWARGAEDGLWHPECACNKDPNSFNVGRISRDDFSKFPDNLWRDWQSIQSPKPLKFWVLGYGNWALKRCGEPPANATVWKPFEITAADALSRMDVLIHTTGSSGENWPRVLFEAWASGVVPIFERDTGASEIITDGVDGFLVANGVEAAQKASLLAQDDALRLSMVKAGYETLLREHCNVERSVGPFLPLLEGCPEVTDPPLRKPGVIDHSRVRAINDGMNDIVRDGHSRFMVVQFWIDPDGKVRLNRHGHDFPDSHAEMAIETFAESLRKDVASRDKPPAPPARKLVIGVHTFPESPMPAVARETWIPRARALGFEVLFYSGGGTEQAGDVLHFPLPTDYNNCSTRMAAFAKWMQANRPDAWLFDIDDDTLVIPDRLNEFLSNSGDYVGFDLGGWISGGAGMMLSPKCVGILAEKGVPAGAFDDTGIGKVLTDAGISLTHDDRFRPWWNSAPNDGNEPTPSNAYITGHCKSPKPDPYEQRIARMRHIWRDVTGPQCVIGVMTFPGSPLVNTCRETWVQRARNLGFEVVFYSGSPKPCCGHPWELRWQGDTLLFPVEADYAHSCDRMAAFAKWLAKERSGHSLFICDDDTLILPDRLLAMLPTAGEYVGWGCDANHRIGHGGAGVLLSARAVALLAEKGLPATGHHDIEIGNVMYDNGIQFTHDVRFRPHRNTLPGDQNEPTPANSYVTCHCKSPENDPHSDRVALMLKLWKECGAVSDEEEADVYRTARAGIALGQFVNMTLEEAAGLIRAKRLREKECA